MKPTLSIVVPLYNEGAKLTDNVQAIGRCAGDAVAGMNGTFELVLVDDGSEDDTWSKVTAVFGEAELVVRALRFSRNFGKEAAVAAGLEHARGDCVIVMDADLQHPPELISEMVARWSQGDCDVVNAVKTDRGSESFAYRLSAGLFNTVTSSLSGFNLSGASDYKLLDRKVVDAFLRLHENQTFYRGLVAWLGFRQADVSMQVGERHAGRSTWSLARLVRLASTGMISFSTAALRLVSVLGLVFFFAALAFGVYTFVQWYRGDAVEGFATVIILQLVIGSSIMLALGVIGEYLAAIYYECKKRPRYVVAETLES
jgi:glycosyltransferase involved in cell wall biosynthesis